MGSCQSISSSESKSDSRQKSKPQLVIKSFTWSRDSHGLFDYESKTLTKKNIKSSNSGRIVRRSNDVSFTRESDQPLNVGDKELIQLNIREGNYWVAPCRDSNAKKLQADGVEQDPEDSENSLWMIVKSFKAAGSNRTGCKLSEGDLLKLGRIKFRVKELRGSTVAAQAAAEKKANLEKVEKHTKIEEDNLSMEDSPKRQSKLSFDSKASTAQTCRICLGEGGEPEDPFFSPCRCTGTMRYIHVQCLQRWLKSKLHVKQTNFSTSIYWKTLECELCKTTYLSTYNIEGKKYDIVEVDRPECGYLMLEILSKEKNILRGIHIIKMEGKNNVRLGRGHDSDIRVTDISVSRCHAVIRLEKGHFYIEDNASKFGTLIHMKRPFALFGDYNNISLQLGRTVVTLSVKKNWKTLQGCFGGDNVRNPIEMDYEDMFEKAPQIQSQQTEVLPARSRNIEQVEHIGAFDEHDDIQNQDIPVPGEHHEQEDINLDDDNVSHDSAEDAFQQQIAAAPGELVQQPEPQEQANANVALAQNENPNPNPNPSPVTVQVAVVHENQAAPQVGSEVVQNQPVVQAI